MLSPRYLLALPSVLAIHPWKVASQTPPPLHWEAVGYDQSRSRLVLFGGGAVDEPRRMIRPSETWEWNGASWEVAQPADAGPSGRVAPGIGYDAASRRMVLYGGVRDTAFNTRGVPLCDTWFYDGARWTAAPAAGCVTTATATPLHDPARGVLLLVDGVPSNTAPERRVRLWAFLQERWQLIDSTGPRSEEITRVAFDSARAVLVLPILAGPDTGVWEWNGLNWRHVRATGPSARGAYGLAYLAPLARTVLVGGRAVEDNRFLDDVWLWDGSRWEPHTPNGRSGPSPRSHANLVADPRNRRLLYFGGAGSGGVVAELWQLGVDGWQQLEPR